MSLALLFPGQGSQKVGMGKDLYDSHESVRAIFDKADQVLGRPISKICFEGPQEELTQTINAQPGIFLVSAAILTLLKEEGVPEDFKFLAVIESGLENVRSPKGAKGFWQLMPGTAKEYGLEVNNNVDERYHIEKSTRVACKYLLKAKERFGTWTLAAASYNRGMLGIDRLLKKQLLFL